MIINVREISMANNNKKHDNTYELQRVGCLTRLPRMNKLLQIINEGSALAMITES